MKNRYIIILFFSSLLNAQNSTNVNETYLDLNHQITTRDKAIYCAVESIYNDTITNIKKYYLTNKAAVLVEDYYLDLTNKKQGKYKSYFKTGTIKEDGVYLNNNKEGQWKFYDSCKKGNDSIYIPLISRNVSYRRGKKNGNFIEYDYNFINTLFGVGQYKNDNLIGNCKWYYFGDSLRSLETYNDKGQLISIKQWELFGKEVFDKEKTHNIKPMHSKDSRVEYLKSKIETAMILNFDIHSNTRLQKSVNKIYLKILVDKKGKIHTLKAKGTFGVNKIYEDKARQVIENMSSIEPFYKNNKATDLKISFYVRVAPRVVNNLY